MDQIGIMIIETHLEVCEETQKTNGSVKNKTRGGPISHKVHVLI